ncbi:MAG: DEAD/DEAH box helicase [Porticoccaceae bacterium]|nr:DEAD/DEAH box helicase [Porticoccaceae bacterium]
MSSADFQSLGLSTPVLKAVKQLGYEQPSPVQAQSIPILLNGNNLLGTAQTGTGKTAAFALPFLSKIDEKQRSPQVLVLTPTRELAIQVAEAFQSYAKYMKGFNVLPIYGGADIGSQLRSLKRGVQIVVGTPGRMLDHLRRRSLDLSQIKGLILDEADEMLRMGFIDDVETILAQTPPECQRALFSATMPPTIRRVAEKYLGDAERVNIEAKTKTVERIDQQYVTVKSHQKMDALTRVMEVEDFDGVIIFVRTKSSTVDIAERLEARGFSSAALNGDLSQALRERTINRLKKGQVDVVVATDVAARGLDVERISHVINFDIPYDNESYVHRIGRTGRAGREGKAILFITPKETRLLRSIEKSTRQSITPLTMPTNAQVSDQRIQQFTNQLMNTLETPRLDKFRDLITRFAAENELDMADIAAALTYENQKERPLFPKLDNIVAPRDQNRERNRGDKSERRENRSKRDDRPKQEPRLRDESGNEIPMVTYRLEVGNDDGITPSNIVGAIANEADISSRYIGSIKLHDDYSTVDLPEGMPDELLAHLKKVRVCGKPMRMSAYTPVASASPSDNKAPRQPRVRKALSRDSKNKRSASSQKPAMKSSANKKSVGGKLGKKTADSRTVKGKSSSDKRRPTDGSGPIKKKKSYTKKPKKSKS